MKWPEYTWWQSEENGLWYFRLQSTNGRVQHPSEGYDTKASMLRGISDLRRNAVIAIVVERRTPKAESP